MMAFRRFISFWIVISFLSTLIIPVPKAQANELLGLPVPGTMVSLSPAYEPMMIKGLTVHKDNPFLFDFIVDTGDTPSLVKEGDRGSLKQEATKLIKYFLASLTIPEKDLWVNLSPYEKDRTIPEELSKTDMGRDLLAQDYILKQITASLIYPEKQLGKTFWDRVYTKAQELYGTTEVPVNTFNKVWIMADKAEVFEHNQTAFVTASHLKVMLEEDYLAMSKHTNVGVTEGGASPSRAQAFASNPGSSNLTYPQNKAIGTYGQDPNINALGSKIIREIILPELEGEVNTGKNFAPLRQIFNSLILASWYKKNLKNALLNQVYSDHSKVKGLEYTPSVTLSNAKGLKDSSPAAQNDVEIIYQRYLQAYKKGVFNYIKEDINAATNQPLPRKYFSGGLEIAPRTVDIEHDLAMGTQKLSKEFAHAQMFDLTIGLTTAAILPSLANRAMLTEEGRSAVDKEIKEYEDKRDNLTDADKDKLKLRRGGLLIEQLSMEIAKSAQSTMFGTEFPFMDYSDAIKFTKDAIARIDALLPQDQAMVNNQESETVTLRNTLLPYLAPGAILMAVAFTAYVVYHLDDPVSFMSFTFVAVTGGAIFTLAGAVKAWQKIAYENIQLREDLLESSVENRQEALKIVERILQHANADYGGIQLGVYEQPSITQMRIFELLALKFGLKLSGKNNNYILNGPFLSSDISKVWYQEINPYLRQLKIRLETAKDAAMFAPKDRAMAAPRVSKQYSDADVLDIIQRILKNMSNGLPYLPELLGQGYKIALHDPSDKTAKIMEALTEEGMPIDEFSGGYFIVHRSFEERAKKWLEDRKNKITQGQGKAAADSRYSDQEVSPVLEFMLTALFKDPNNLLVQMEHLYDFHAFPLEWIDIARDFKTRGAPLMITEQLVAFDYTNPHFTNFMRWLKKEQQRITKNDTTNLSIPVWMKKEQERFKSRAMITEKLEEIRNKSLRKRVLSGLLRNVAGLLVKQHNNPGNSTADTLVTIYDADDRSNPDMPFHQDARTIMRKLSQESGFPKGSFKESLVDGVLGSSMQIKIKINDLPIFQAWLQKKLAENRALSSNERILIGFVAVIAGWIILSSFKKWKANRAMITPLVAEIIMPVATGQDNIDRMRGILVQAEFSKKIIDIAIKHISGASNPLSLAKQLSKLFKSHYNDLSFAQDFLDAVWLTARHNMGLETFRKLIGRRKDLNFKDVSSISSIYGPSVFEALKSDAAYLKRRWQILATLLEKKQISKSLEKQVNPPFSAKPILEETIHKLQEELKALDLRLSITNMAMKAPAIDGVANGGIDLTQNGMGWTVRKQGNGVEMTVDPAAIERVRREGIDSLTPVIFRVTPIVSIWPIIGLEPPKNFS